MLRPLRLPFRQSSFAGHVSTGPHVAASDAWLFVVFLALILLFLQACGGSTAQQPPPTSVTSGTIASPTQPNDQQQLTSARISELETERDRALLQANDAQAQAAATRERSEKAIKALVVRNDFEDSMWAKLERIDARMRTLRLDSARLFPDARGKVHRQLETIADRRNTVERELHRVHGVPVADFDAYAREVEQSINAVSRDVESIELK